MAGKNKSHQLQYHHSLWRIFRYGILSTQLLQQFIFNFGPCIHTKVDNYTDSDANWRENSLTQKRYSLFHKHKFAKNSTPKLNKQAISYTKNYAE